MWRVRTGGRRVGADAVLCELCDGDGDGGAVPFVRRAVVVVVDADLVGWGRRKG